MYFISQRINVVITSYDRCKKAPVFFKSRKAKLDKDDDYLLTDCIKAATAAPTIWPHHQIKETLYMDALFGKNPALFGIIEALGHYDADLSSIQLLSLGTGRFYQTKSVKEVLLSGLGFFYDIFVDTINATTDSTDYMVKRLLKGDAQILSLEPSLSKEHEGICDCSKSNIEYLIETTQQYIKDHDHEIVAFANKLMEEDEDD